MAGPAREPAPVMSPGRAGARYLFTHRTFTTCHAPESFASWQ